MSRRFSEQSDEPGEVLAGGSERRIRELASSRGADAPPRLEIAPTGRPEWWTARRPGAFAAALYLGDAGDRRGPGPCLREAERFFRGCIRLSIPRVVVVSSAAVYEPSAHHPGMALESHPPSRRSGNPIARRWRRLEDLARETLAGVRSLTLLRPAAVLFESREDYFGAFLGGGWAVRLPGHDPTLQFLDPRDLAAAAFAALASAAPGTAIRHVAPSAAIPLRAALAAAGVRSFPVPRTLQRPARWLLGRLGAAFPLPQTDYIRHGWTIDSLHEAPRPARSSLQALLKFRRLPPPEGVETRFDDFGMDPDYIRRRREGLFKFLHDLYWRVEHEGIEQIPARGPGVLVGVHRGFMPFDGVMALHELAGLRGRIPRFLVHPGLTKFPFFHDFIIKLGGVPAFRENAERVLRGGEILGVFPEGVRGAFAMYRDAYRLRKFGRLEFVRLALRHRAPILPFVTVGSAEAFPILAKIESSWWRRHAEWPFIPITPTFPWLPAPLPSKWRTVYLEPLRVDRTHPPEAADDPRAVREIGRLVRRRMQAAIDQLLARRKSLFFG